MKQPHDRATAELPLPPVPAAAALPGWREQLLAAIEADPRRSAGVAEKLGVSRVYVSRVLTGSIPVASPRFVSRVVALCQRVHCPHLDTSLPPDECRAYAARQYAQIDAAQVPHWRACQRCSVKAPPAPEPRPSKPAVAAAAHQGDAA